ncbi:hypothetical protein B0H15DRAFT_935339 [Mycena belliarum]|uniref:Uncharacterized protein n=1 Tax=Mycena belliarum TaxID=1033014 RepID=A0AAD6TMJ0_9AGAR|nr:hypothetical protein B0H15DRAFT_935339 [Mycena belliae]
MPASVALVLSFVVHTAFTALSIFIVPTIARHLANYSHSLTPSPFPFLPYSSFPSSPGPASGKNLHDTKVLYIHKKKIIDYINIDEPLQHWSPARNASWHNRGLGDVDRALGTILRGRALRGKILKTRQLHPGEEKMALTAGAALGLRKALSQGTIWLGGLIQELARETLEDRQGERATRWGEKTSSDSSNMATIINQAHHFT